MSFAFTVVFVLTLRGVRLFIIGLPVRFFIEVNFLDE